MEIETSLQILKEWIFTYVSENDIDFNFTRPTLTEGEGGLNKPLLYVEVLPGKDYQVGMGKRISGSYRGMFHDVAIFLFIVVSDSVGGMPRARQISDNLRWMFLTRGFELSAAGLKSPEISSIRELTKENYGEFYGARHMVTFRTTLVFA
jgi:hypothetical protein